MLGKDVPPARVANMLGYENLEEAVEKGILCVQAAKTMNEVR
jgi:hypothetical protein